MLGAGGTTAAEIAAGADLRFLGAPVKITPVMPKTPGDSQVPALFGDLEMAATYGDRQSLTIEGSTEYKFAERQVTVLGTQRIAINIDELSDAENAGPLVGLITPPAA